MGQMHNDMPRAVSRRTLLRGAVGAWAGAVAVGGTRVGAVSELRITCDPPVAVLDSAVRIRVTGLDAGKPVTLRAAMYDGVPREWTSAATFMSDGTGAVDLAVQAPRSGSYDGVDAMGLFWSMQPSGGADSADAPLFTYHTPGPRTLPMTLTADMDGAIVAAATLERRIFADDVQRIPVEGQSFVGTLYRPTGPGPYGGVIVLGGSEGGQPGQRAALLAAHGFVTLSVAYFGASGVPQQLANISLEYFAPAIRWLREQEGVRPDRIGVVGTSRGGELALLLGATYPDIRAVVGYVPSGLVWTGFGDDPMAPIPPAWTYQGMPVPFVNAVLPPDEGQRLFMESQAMTRAGEPFAITPFFRAQVMYATNRAEAEIPVERINGPVLLLSGEADALWPSVALSEIVVERLAREGFPHPVTHLRYPDAGHLIGTPYLPTTVTSAFNPSARSRLTFGGTAAGTAAANADSWLRVIAFLHDALNP